MSNWFKEKGQSKLGFGYNKGYLYGRITEEIIFGLENVHIL